VLGIVKPAGNSLGGKAPEERLRVEENEPAWPYSN
jgi:hypothetical protein